MGCRVSGVAVVYVVSGASRGVGAYWASRGCRVSGG